jgi:hypothetical protein
MHYLHSASIPGPRNQSSLCRCGGSTRRTQCKHIRSTYPYRRRTRRYRDARCERNQCSRTHQARCSRRTGFRTVLPRRYSPRRPSSPSRYRTHLSRTQSYRYRLGSRQMRDPCNRRRSGGIDRGRARRHRLPSSECICSTCCR